MEEGKGPKPKPKRGLGYQAKIAEVLRNRKPAPKKPNGQRKGRKLRFLCQQRAVISKKIVSVSVSERFKTLLFKFSTPGAAGKRGSLSLTVADVKKELKLDSAICLPQNR